METLVEELGPCKRKISITIPQEEVKTAIDKSYGELRQNISLPGFRKGKTPRRVLEKRFGDQVASDVKRDLIVDGISTGIESHDLEVVSDPNFNFDAINFAVDSDLTFDVEVEVRPDFELPNFDDIEVTKTVETVTASEVEGIIEKLRRDQTMMVPMEDGNSQHDDLVIGSVEFSDGDEVVANYHQIALTAGVTEEICDIEVENTDTLLVDLGIDAEINIEVEVPDDHDVEDLQGRKLTLKFIVEEIKRKELPTLDDEFAEGMGQESVAALKARIESDLQEHKDNGASNEAADNIIDKILGLVDIPLPESSVQKTVEAQSRQVLMQRVMAGQSLAADSTQLQAEIKTEILPMAERSIRAWYVMQKIAKREKIFVTETDFNTRVEELAAARHTTPTAIRKEIVDQNATDEIRMEILEEKVRKWLLENIKIVENSSNSVSDSEAAE